MFVGSALVEFYAKCGVMGDAVKVFDGFREPDVVLWTSVVTGFQRNGEAEEAVSFFSRMVVGNMVVPDPVTVVSLVSAIGQLGDLRAAKCCHGYVIRMQLGLKNLSVVNSVLSLYSKLGAVQSAAKLFDVMGERDLISWSCMITCYAHSRMATEALGVYRRLVEMGLEPNEVTAVSIIQACTLALDLREGRRVHEVAIQKGFELEAAVSTSLIDMYMKCGCYSDAIDLFNRMPKKDAVSWGAVIGGSAQNGFANESLKLFIAMLSNGVRPDAVTMVKVLAACSQLGMLRQAHCFHNYSVRSGFDSQPFVGAALVDLYSKCGSLDETVQVFDSISEKDVVLWSSMIAGYGIHGHARKAIDTFNWMVESSVRPNSVTLVSVLSACSHAGLVEEGKRIFSSMSRVYGLTPNSEHCGIIVDLLGRNGELSEAMKLIEGGSSAVGPHVWCALLAGCRTHNNIEIGKVVAKNLLDVEPNHAGYYNLLSNLYAFDGRWSDVAEVRGLMKERGLRKTPGFSSIEVANEVHTFLAGERWHREWERICEVLKRLEVKMRGEGCVANDVRLCETYGTLQ